MRKAIFIFIAIIMHIVPDPCVFAFVFRSQAAGKTVTVTAVTM